MDKKTKEKIENEVPDTNEFNLESTIHEPIDDLPEPRDNEVEVKLEVEAKSELYSIKVSRKLDISLLSLEIDNIINQISKSKQFKATPIKDESQTQPPIITSSDEDPVSIFATKIGVNPDDFVKSKLIAIKNDDVQILKPTKITARNGGMLLLAINEYVFNNTTTPYKEWKELCEVSNLKSKTPIYQIAGDIKNGGYIDKKTYDNTPKKEMKLTPKAIEVIRKFIEKFLEEN